MQVSEIDLIMQYNKETGDRVCKDQTERLENFDYCKWLEEKYLEKLNEDREVNELFVDENISN